MATPIRYVTLDPEVWARGHTDNITNLLLFHDRGRRQQCCIGVACTALGLSDDEIDGVCYPSEIDVMELPPQLQRLAELSGSPVTRPRAYQINDSAYFDSDADRVKAINADLKKNAIPLRFRLKRESKKGL